MSQDILHTEPLSKPVKTISLCEGHQWGPKVTEQVHMIDKVGPSVDSVDSIADSLLSIRTPDTMYADQYQ